MAENEEINLDTVKEMVLTITLKQDGNVSINGPLIQKPICLYMLELAKDIVKMYNPNPQKIIKPISRIKDIFNKH